MVVGKCRFLLQKEVSPWLINKSNWSLFSASTIKDTKKKEKKKIERLCMAGRLYMYNCGIHRRLLSGSSAKPICQKFSTHLADGFSLSRFVEFY